jgi:hypothetical protein
MPAVAQLRFSEPTNNLFGPIIWGVIGLVAFGFLYTASAPKGQALHDMRAAGPDGVTAYFRSPETAIIKINRLVAAHDWIHLARYYDFSLSTISPEQLLSGAYFDGTLAAGNEGARPRPFPPGWRLLYAEPTEIEGITRVTVAPPGPQAPAPTVTQSFLLKRLPEGYRILPEDAAPRLPGPPSPP